jgi:aryl-alcohol dehydrogenase (NADP+)
VTLSSDILDRIDELVPPGTMVDPINSDFNPPALTDPTLRRRRR